MMKFLDIIRWKNLLFVAIIQLLMQHAVVYPLLETYGFQRTIYSTPFYLLIIATVLITAGGYVINDYFDLKIDRINKPEKVIVGEKLSVASTMRFYQILSGLGIGLGLFLSIWKGSFTLGFIFLLTPGLLWFYSASYKRQFLTGNLIVSLASALSILIVAILIMTLLSENYSKVLLAQTPIPNQIYAWIGGFAVFAFLLSWIREIIKDMEDLEGDRELECRTMPIVWGLSKAKVFLLLLMVVTITALLLIISLWIPFDGNLTFRYALFTIVVPLLILAGLILKAKSSSDYHQASTLAKIIMLAGVLYALIFYFLTAKSESLSFFGIFTIS